MRVRSRHWLRLLLAAALPSSAAAQVVLDGTVGSAGPGPVAAGLDDQGQPATYLIHDGLGERAEQNLFHSFARFDVGLGETATFTSSSPVPPDNVLARVTGGSESQIYGRLRSTIPGADLWLINPAGWLFGAGSSLDVPGSLHITSGEYVRHEDGTRFGVGLEAAPALSIAPVEAFGFLDAEVGTLTVENTRLDLETGETLSLVGGDIGIRGFAGDGIADEAKWLQASDALRLPSGRLNLVSVASPGEIVLDESWIDPQLDVDSFAQLGRIEVSDGARLLLAGKPGGAAVIRAQDFLLDRAFIDATTLGEEDHPGMALDFNVRGKVSIQGRENEFARAESTTIGPGRGGSIRLRADELRIDHRDLMLLADPGGTLQPPIFFRPTGLQSESQGGDPGSIDIRVRSLGISGYVAVISANRWAPSTARGGDIRIEADEVWLDQSTISANAMFSGSSPPGKQLPPLGQKPQVVQADAGNIEIRTGLLDMKDLGSISATTAGSGHGGRVYIVADRISVRSRLHGGLNAVSIQTFTFGSGEAGDVVIEGRDLTVEGSAGILSVANDPVSAAEQTIWYLETVLGMDPASVEATRAIFDTHPGDGGNIRITLTGRLEVLENGAIFAHTYSAGDAGDIEIHAKSVLLRDTLCPGVLCGPFGSNIASGSFRYGQVYRFGPLLDRPAGRGGNVDIEAGEIDVLPGSYIGASTWTEGDAGSVTIRTNRIFASGTASGGEFIESESVPIESPAIPAPPTYGAAGNVTLIGIGPDSELRVEGTRKISAITRTGNQGGNLLIDGFDHVSVADGGSLTVRSDSGLLAPGAVAGDAGNLTVNVGDILRVEGGGSLTAQSDRSDAGNIRISAGTGVELFDGSITAQVDGGPDTTGGNITIDPKWVILEDGSVISARASEGQGGNVSIRTQGLFVSPDSLISASSQYGLSGTVAVDSPESNLSGELASMSEDYLDAAGLIADRCGVGQRSGGSFAVNDGPEVAPAPDAALSSPLLELAGNELAQTR